MESTRKPRYETTRWTRCQAAWERTRSKSWRFAARVFARFSQICQRRINIKRPDLLARSATRIPTLTAWATLIEQFSNPETLRTLINSGILGSDLPRAFDAPVNERILVLAAHQDDELIGAGGTCLLAAQNRCEFQVVYTTDGSTRFGCFPERDVIALRHDEARSIWHRLANTEPHFLDLPNCREEPISPEAVERLSQLIREFQPTAIFLPNFLEQPREHRRVTELLSLVDQQQPLTNQIDVWGYQITTRLSHNTVIDISSVHRKKYRLNKLWKSQNTYRDYAQLALGQDLSNAYYLKRTPQPRATGAHAEIFLRLGARDYLTIARQFLSLEGTDTATLNSQATALSKGPDFFVAGMQKSGSYWLTALLDAHPEIRCFPSRPGLADGSGEAHLFDHLSKMETDWPSFRESMTQKLDGLFRELIPELLPATESARTHLQKQLRDRFNEYCDLQRRLNSAKLVGEKTTESVHHPQLIEQLYPGIKKLIILRDPRDRVVSFHFHQIRKGRLPVDAPVTDATIDQYLERLRADYHGLLLLPDPVFVLTYEQLSTTPFSITQSLLEFLQVSHPQDVVKRVVEAASFQQLASRTPGDEHQQSHFRKGITGDWQNHLSIPQANRLVAELQPLTDQIATRFSLELSSDTAVPECVSTGE